MANYYEQGRSNYFQVKSKPEFVAWLQGFDTGLELIEDEEEGMVGFLAPEGLPNQRTIKAASGEDCDDEHVDIDFCAELAEHLEDDAVAIVIVNGHENLRYLSGFAFAVNNKGEKRSVDIDSIYELAKKLTSEPYRVSRPEY